MAEEEVRDAETVQRVKQEFLAVYQALEAQGEAREVDLPDGSGRAVLVKKSIRRTRGGDFLLRQGEEERSCRYLRLRSWGPNGFDFVERFEVVREAGATRFQGCRVHPDGTAFLRREPNAEDLRFLREAGVTSVR